MTPRTLARLYPFVFSAVPALAFFSTNRGHQLLSSLLYPLLVSLAVAAVATALARAAARDPHAGAFKAFVLVGWFFAAGQIGELLPPEVWVFGYSVATSLPSQAALAATALLLLRVDLGAQGEKVTQALALFSAVLAGMNLVSIALDSRPGTGRRPAAAARPVRTLPSRLPPAASLPDVVVVVLDGYGRGDVLRETYGFDNSPFLDGLRRRGFFVASRALANYPQTGLSLASALNLDYIPALLPDVRPRSTSRTPLTDLIQQNRVLDLLRAAGYRSTSFANGYRIAELRSVDRFVTDGPSLDPFLRAFLALTPLRALEPAAHQRPQGGVHRDAVRFALEHGAEPLAEQRPVLVFAHVICPHPPFVFRADGGVPDDAKLDRYLLHDGDHLKPDDPGRTEWYRRRYVEQVRFLNEGVLRLVDAVDATKGRPSAVLILGDHGPGSGLFWEDAAKTDLTERLGILLACRLPGTGHRGLYDTITPVNAFRALLREALAADLPPLPDRSYFATWKAPFVPLEVETAVDGSVRLVDDARRRSAAAPVSLSSSPAPTSP